MDKTLLPSAVVSSDLKPEVEEEDGYKMFAYDFTSFIGQVLNKQNMYLRTTESFFQPFIEGMKLEGTYGMKEPCYGHELLNPDDPSCLKGSPWSIHAQGLMGGDGAHWNADINTIDNFHRVQTITPVHLPEIDNKCDGKTKCTLQTISVSENIYSILDSFDSGKYPIAASEIKAKLMSR